MGDTSEDVTLWDGSPVGHDSVGLGSKAQGLLALPKGWAPRSFVIPASEVTRLADRTPPYGEQGDPDRQDPNAQLQMALDRLAASTVLVRSSGIGEVLNLRGASLTQRAPSSAAAVRTALEACLHHWMARCQDPTASGEKAALAALIQPAIEARLTGHLSNERRVARRPSQWMYEAQSAPGGALQLEGRIRIRESDPPATLEDLRCQHQEDLPRHLRRLAQWLRKHIGICHVEWLFDGHRIWVVQCDRDVAVQGVRPILPPYSPPAPLPPLSLFTPPSLEHAEFHKVHCVATFEAAAIPTGDVRILSADAVSRALVTPTELASLEADLTALASSGMVLRTDVRHSRDNPGFFLPRTSTVSSADAALKWLHDALKKFCTHSVALRDVLFVAHRFIPSRSAAWAYARPDDRRVAIDATWGIAEGLNYLPCDNFEVLLREDGSRERMRKALRCKDEYITCAADGRWISAKCPQPYDWQPSLDESELDRIALWTWRLAQSLKRPVHTMYFVCPGGPGTNLILPWYYPPEEHALVGADRSSRYFISNSYVVTNALELERLEQLPEGACSALELRPTIELGRSVEFLKRVAQSAIRLGVRVRCHGSILAHTYYVLRREGARVECVGLVAESEQPQKYDKLVRDLIPQKIAAGGEVVRVSRVRAERLVTLLKGKVVEEALELQGAETQSAVIDEMADVLEVLRALMREIGVTEERVDGVARDKRARRGGFSEGILLHETTEPPLVPGSESQSQMAWASGQEAGRPPHERVEFVDRQDQIPVLPQPTIVGGKRLVIPLAGPSAVFSDDTHLLRVPSLGQKVTVIRRRGVVQLLFEPLTESEQEPGQLQLPF